MKFYIEEVLVYFPYALIYPEQYDYMCHLKKSLDACGPTVLEMPSGTGKTVCLLSLITSYQLVHPDVGKLVYCSRTVSEIEKTVQELKRIIAYREEKWGEPENGVFCPSFLSTAPPPFASLSSSSSSSSSSSFSSSSSSTPPKFLALALSSRRNLCIHERVSQQETTTKVDAECRNMTASFVRKQATTNNDIQLCEFYEKFDETNRDVRLTGVLGLGDLREIGRKRGWCPYFLARHLLEFANVVVYSYQYVLHPRISELVSSSLGENCILVFDEAHNIDNVCVDALTLNLSNTCLANATKKINQLDHIIAETKRKNQKQLKTEYDRLVEGLSLSSATPIADQIPIEPVLKDDVLKEPVPGNMRKAEHFTGLLLRFIEHLKMKLRKTNASQHRPSQFLRECTDSTFIDARHLRFCTSRLGSLLWSLEISDIAEYASVSTVADFATLVGSYDKGFALVIIPASVSERKKALLQFLCLDASIAMEPVFSKYRSVIITSGTLSPLGFYPKLLGFQPVVTQGFEMTLNRPCVCPLIVTRGSDQLPMCSKHKVRNDPAVIRNYGYLLLDIIPHVPDGVVCFFPSYEYLSVVLSVWNEMEIVASLLKQKLLFVETTDGRESSLALEHYRKACDCGRGAIMLCVARGKVSEGVDFDRHYGRGVIVYGIPYVYTEDRTIRARLEYLRDEYQVKEADFLNFDAMRNAAQCVGRVIRGKDDYGVLIFADIRYSRADKLSKLPKWIGGYLTPSHNNLSTDEAVSLTKKFFKDMAQPLAKEEQMGTALWKVERVSQQSMSKMGKHFVSEAMEDVDMINGGGAVSMVIG